MFKIGPFFFPDGETHFTMFGDDVAQYGNLDREVAYRHVKQWRCAIDVGANVGIFSTDFASRFEEVIAFEPVPRTRKCLKRNVPPNVRVEPFAIADKRGVLKMVPCVTNSGGSCIHDHPRVFHPIFEFDQNDTIDVRARTIDSYRLDNVDLIKLDVQGAEYVALMGARKTIRRCRPVIMMEQKPGTPEAANCWKKASKLLRSMGMTAKERAQSDRVFVFED